MRYYLDFDRTLFDTPAFKRSLIHFPTPRLFLRETKELFTGMKQTPEKRWQLLREGVATLVSTGHLFFNPDELKNYLYPDVPDFLTTHGNEITIVTYGVQAFLMAKIVSALSDFTVDKVVYTTRRKGYILRKFTKNDTPPFAFVDDFHFQCASVARWCPNVKVFEIRRDTRKPDGRWPVIHSLTNLPQEMTNFKE